RIQARITSHCVRDALLAEQLLARARLGQSVGLEEQEVAGVERHLEAAVLAVGSEREQRPGGAERAELAVVPEPGGWVPRRREAQRARGLVEHSDAQRDELIAPVLGGENRVELL